MSYLKDFQKKIQQNNYYEFLKLWEEYCHSETPDVDELIKVLILTKDSILAVSFANHVDRALSLWKLLEEGEKKDKVLKLILDIQNTNTDELAEIAYNYLKNKHGSEKHFAEKIRLIGLRSRKTFQGAISKYELLTHLNKGKFVFHTSGWGTGEIVDLSLIREEMSLEFEYVIGKKNIAFEKALNTLIPLSDDHFLARRFGDPDSLEALAKKDPILVITMLLKDLGPKSAVEIKEELCDLVIPEEDWPKWWQSIRNKMKKSTMIDVPKGLHTPFKLRESSISHEDSLYLALEKKPNTEATIQLVYSFIKDFPETLKNQDFKTSLHTKLKDLFSCENLKLSQKLSLLFLLYQIFGEATYKESLKKIIEADQKFDELVDSTEIVAFKKKLLSCIKENRKDWQEIFFNQMFSVKQNILRDYILSQLEKIDDTQNLKNKLNSILDNPRKDPIVFLWYFQKIIGEKKPLLLSDQKSKNRFFEAFMILLDDLFQRPKHKDLARKMISILTGNKYKIVRDFMEKATIEEVKEFLLLSTKCNLLSDHEKKIIHSLGEVVFPELKQLRKTESIEEEILWTTKEGYEKLQNKLKQLATVETVSNAKEIEEARALGDLRENAEYKAALERRNRLQSEITLLSSQLNKARILTKVDVDITKAGVGTLVECESKEGIKTFTILGPFDANPEKNIVSFQSNLAQKMNNLKTGDVFTVQDIEYRIKKITSFLS